MVSATAHPLDTELARARACAAAVPDPEIPVLTLEDLGILRDVAREGARIVVTLTPTYTGCPATEAIAEDVRTALAVAGFGDAAVRTTLSPPWTTDWISAEGRRKLREYGIAPPGPVQADGAVPLKFMPRRPGAVAAVECPRCGSARTERLSAFGSTACKAMYRCLACREPFEHFKPI